MQDASLNNTASLAILHTLIPNESYKNLAFQETISTKHWILRPTSILPTRNSSYYSQQEVV